MTTCTRCGRQHRGYGLCPQCRSEEDENKRRERILADQQYLIRQQQRQFDRAQSESRAQAEGEAKRAAFSRKFIEFSQYAKERDLISVCVNVDFSLIENYKTILLAGRAKAFGNFVADATKDDRCIDLMSFSLTMTKSSTLKELREALNNSTEMLGTILLRRASSDSCDFYACSSSTVHRYLPENGYEGKEVKIPGYNYIFFLPEAKLPQFLSLLAHTESQIAAAYCQIEDIKKNHVDATLPVMTKEDRAKPFLFTCVRAFLIFVSAFAILSYAYLAHINSLVFAILCIGIGIVALTMLIKSGRFMEKISSKLRDKRVSAVKRAEEVMLSEIIAALNDSKSQTSM